MATYEDWRQPVKHLRAMLSNVTRAQLDLARHLKLSLPKDAPKLLADALLQDALGPTIGRLPRPPSSGQLEYLDDLSEWLTPEDPEPITHAVASALIAILSTRQSVAALEELQPCKDDLVVETRSRYAGADGWRDEDLRLIASVGDDGTIHFQGGGGRRASAHRVILLHRLEGASPDEQTPYANARAAARIHADALRHSYDMSVTKVNRLREWEVRERRTHYREVDELRGVVESALDERPIQDYLERKPHILGLALLTGGHGWWVRPQLRFGDRYVADFLVADADSAGIHWKLVELESPRVKVFSKAGEWRKEARHAQHQISTWRHYLSENLDAARKDRHDEGLGLVDIESGVRGVILISRRSLMGDNPTWMRRRLKLDSGIEMHTYDWLVDQVEHSSLGHRGQLED